jgi:hypothetical protein
MEKTHKDRMSSAIRAWIIDLDQYPGWRKWKHKQVGYTLHFDDPLFSHSHEKMFVFSEEIERQHVVISQYIALQSTILSLKDCEYYFRRYPFPQKNEVSHHDHITNVCEMYFSRFYEFKERLKKYFNAVKVASPASNLDAGIAIKHFEKMFDQELRARNNIHHDSRFQDIAIDRVYLTGIVSAEPTGKGWKVEHRTAYRKLAKEWAKRVQRRGKKMDEFMEAVAAISLSQCGFLTTAADRKSSRRKRVAS